MTTIRVQIERLVIHGWPDGRPEELRAAVEAELVRLLTEADPGPGFGSGGAAPSVPVASVGATKGDSAALGAAIGRAVYGGLGQ